MQFSISNHVVERYRERVEKDALREKCSNRQIVRIISSSIKSSPFYKNLEKLIGQRGRLAVELRDLNGESFGNYVFPLCKVIGKGKYYGVVSLLYD